MWIWVFWADTDVLSARLNTAPRILDPVYLAAACYAPFLAEQLLKPAPEADLATRPLRAVSPPSARSAR